MNALSCFERFFGWLLQTTWQAAVIAGIILLAQWLLRNRISPAWRHGLWFLLVARLLMPMTPGSAVSIFNLARWLHRDPAPTRVAALSSGFTGPVADVARSKPGNPAARITVQPDTETGKVLQPARAPSFEANLPAIPAQRTVHSVDWTVVAAFAWLAVAMVLGARFIWLNHRFARRLAGGTSALEEDAMLSQCARDMGVRERVWLIETGEVDSPAVFGLWRKRLLLPVGLRGALSSAELRHVILHELAHLKRRDPELNWLLAWLQMLHWFNPALWFAFARMRADRELATDDLALSCTDKEERRVYGETIVKVLERLTERRVLPGLVGIAESKGELKERMRAIARGGGTRWHWAACAAAIVTAGVALTGARGDDTAKGINLLNRYPATMTAGDAVPSHARPWQFAQGDLFLVSRFRLEVGKQLRVDTGAADLGIGHCKDGAVWAVLIPRKEGRLTSPAATNEEAVGTIWLRFHPGQIARIFPPDTVSSNEPVDWLERMRAIADVKMISSWQSDGHAMIPELKDLTVDVDTQGGPRRFFMVDTAAQAANYVASFAGDSVEAPVRENASDNRAAQVVSVSPANGAKDVEPVQDLRIRFDRPMDPHHLKLEWLAGGFQLNGSIRVSDDRQEFLVPVRLPLGQAQRVAINYDWVRESQRRTGGKTHAEPERAVGASFRGGDLFAANTYQWGFVTRPRTVKPGAAQPKVTGVSPASGTATALLTMVEITFDQPMRPPEESLPFLRTRTFARGARMIPSMDYDARAHRFLLPVLLPPEDDARLILSGFRGADGAACDDIVLHYQTESEVMDANYKKKADVGAKDAALVKLLSSMKERRERLKSGVETVQTISMQSEKSGFKTIEAETATFRWQGTNQAYADITGTMSMTVAFILGCDGNNCWIYSVDDKGKKRLDQTPVAVTKRQILMADPFGFERRSVAGAIADRGLVLEANATLDGHSCHRIQAWDVSTGGNGYASKTQWWIDEETLLPRQYVQYHPYGCEIVRFDFSSLNEQLPDNAFEPPAADGASPLFFKEAPAPGESRFLNISDGSNGRMSGRIGWKSGGGTTSSGLN